MDLLAYIRPRAYSDSSDLRILVPDGMRSFDVTVRAAGQTIVSVPMKIPDGFPRSINAEVGLKENWARNVRVKMSRDLIFVAFKRETAREDRQAALDAVDGDVVAGSLGRYCVRLRIPKDSVGSGPVLRAVNVLRGMTGVVAASIVSLDPVQLMSRRPVDDPVFNHWRLNPDSAADASWALEAVAAPAAWGCSIGSAATSVAIVDDGFRNLPDLRDNFGSDTSFQAGTYHGTAVASILSARGNNNLGMVGMMWESRLGLFYMNQPDSSANLPIEYPYKAILRAGLAGYPIINASWGLGWNRRPGGDSASVDSSRVTDHALALKGALDSLRALNLRPLIVVAAGNDTTNAYWGSAAAGLKALTHDYDDQILIVGATRQSNSPSTRMAIVSNYGPLVDVVAPGEHVPSVDTSGTLIWWNGTSLAAPLVSGLAGLLLDFDPSFLSASARAGGLKSYIVDGAIAGNREAYDVLGTHLPQINAYESLKIASQQSGAPLCHTRVWMDGTTLKADRGVAHNASLATVTLPSVTPYALVSYQGGKLLNLLDNNGTDHTLSWKSVTRSWSVDSVVSQPVSGFFNSSLGYSTRLDTSSYASYATNDYDPSVPVGTQRWWVAIFDSTYTKIDSVSIDLPYGPMLTFGSFTQPANGGVTAFTAFPQNGGKLLVAINIDTVSMATYEQNGVDDRGIPTVYHYAIFSESALRANIYSVDLQTMTVDSIKSIPNRSVYWIGYNDLDNEVVYATGQLATASSTAGGSTSPVASNCEIHWTGPQMGTDRLLVATASACPTDDRYLSGPWGATGGLSPLLMPMGSARFNRSNPVSPNSIKSWGSPRRTILSGFPVSR